MGGLALTLVVGMVAWAFMPKSWAAAGYGATLAQLLQRMTAVENKTQFMSVSGNDVIFTGCNIHIRNGLGATNGNPSAPLSDTGTTNGLGNLIVGYNELHPAPYVNNRTGSHNIVVGRRNNFSSYGGLVVGEANTISGVFASVSGGGWNAASGSRSSVSGGGQQRQQLVRLSQRGGWNVASGLFVSISGGSYNKATGFLASVSGGDHNTASGDRASVSGGASITQSSNNGWSAGSLGTTTYNNGNFRSP